MPIPYEDLQLLSAVFGKIKSDYVEPVSDDKLIKEAINGMVHGLDPHSDFLDAEAFKDLQISTQGKFGGLGIEVGVEDGIVRVDLADRGHAGVPRRDQVRATSSSRSTTTRRAGMPLSKAVEKMRGKPGTSVVLTVVRKDAEAPLTFTLDARRDQRQERPREDARARLRLHPRASSSRTAPPRTSPRRSRISTSRAS